jgi:hypothetical protein
MSPDAAHSDRRPAPATLSERWRRAPWALRIGAVGSAVVVVLLSAAWSWPPLALLALPYLIAPFDPSGRTGAGLGFLGLLPALPLAWLLLSLPRELRGPLHEAALTLAYVVLQGAIVLGGWQAWQPGQPS